MALKRKNKLPNRAGRAQSGKIKQGPKLKIKAKTQKASSTLKKVAKKAAPKKIVLYRSASQAKHNEEVLSRTSVIKYPLAIGFFIFASMLLFMKLYLLTGLNSADLLRYEQVQSISALFNNPIEPIHGFLQWVSLIALPDNQIAALRAPSALMILVTLLSLTLALYYKSGNRYMPYVFFLLGASSPALVWLSHLGYIGLIDWVVLLSVSYTSYVLLSQAQLNYKLRVYFYAFYFLGISLMLLEPLGLLIAPIFVSRTLLKTEGVGGGFKENLKDAWGRILAMGLKAKIFMGAAAFISVSLVVTMFIVNSGTWKTLTGWSVVQDFVTNIGSLPKTLSENLLSVVGIGKGGNTDLIGASADFVLIAALIIVTYFGAASAWKKFRARRSDINREVGPRFKLLKNLAIALLIIALSLVEPAGLGLLPLYLITTAAVAYIIAFVAKRVDDLFPVNPYPKILAKTLLLTLTLGLVAANIVNISNQIGRANSANDVNIRLESSPSKLRIVR